MDKYMKKSDVIAYIRNKAKEAQSAFEELGGESGIIAEAFEDLANELEDFPATDVAPVQPGFWEDAPTVAAVPASKILALRDALYEADAVTMRGLRNLNMLIAKYEGGKEK